MSSTVFYQLYIITISISFVYSNRLQKVQMTMTTTDRLNYIECSTSLTF